MHNLKGRVVVAFLAAFAMAAGTASAVVVDGVTYDAPDYVLMSGNDTGYFSSMTGAVHWVGGRKPASGSKYFIQKNSVFRTPKNDDSTFPLATFAGDSLTLGGGVLTHCINSGPSETDVPGVKWGDLRLMGGEYRGGCPLNVIRESKLTFIHSAQLGPVLINHNHDGTGSAGSGIYFRNSTILSTSADATAIFYCASAAKGIIFRSCDFSGFAGTFQFGRAEYKHRVYADFGNGTVFPGTVLIVTNGEFRATTSSGELSIDTLRVAPGGMLSTPKTDVTLTVGTLRNDGGTLACSPSGFGMIDVTRELVLDSPFTIAGLGYNVATGAAQTVAIPFMTLPQGTVVPEGSFVYKLVSAGLPRIVISSETVDGKERLSVAKKEIVTIKVRDSSVSGGSSFKEANTSNWSDGRQPHPRADYAIGMSGYGNQLMTSDTTGAASASEGACLFQGDSLTVFRGSLALCDVPVNMFSNLTVVAGSTISSYTGWGTPNHLRGNTLALLPSSSAAVLMSCQNTSWLVVENELLGSADLDLCRHSNEDKNGSCVIDLRAINTNYEGRITLACGGWRTQEATWSGTNMVRQLTLYVRDARNLGGKRPSFAYDALRVRDCQRISITNDVAFTEQTRGLFVDGCARIDVRAGNTLTLLQPLTFAGKMRKEGAGTLALGGTVAFTGERRADPDGLDGTNVLEVVAGAVKPLSKTAADGLAFSFANGASLALDIDPADADVRKYGLYDVLESTPIALAAGAASLPVALDVSGVASPEPAYRIGVVTVKDGTTAAALKGLLSVASPWKGYVVDLSLRDNPEDGGSCTIVATVRQSGMTIIFR